MPPSPHIMALVLDSIPSALCLLWQLELHLLSPRFEFKFGAFPLVKMAVSIHFEVRFQKQRSDPDGDGKEKTTFTSSSSCGREAGSPRCRILRSQIYCDVFVSISAVGLPPERHK